MVFKFHIAASLLLCALGAQATVQLNGTAYINAPVIGGEVEAKCAPQNAPIISKTDQAGQFSIKAAKATLPCMLQARGGYVDGAPNMLKMHGLALKNGATQVSPASDLALAYALKSAPQAAFEQPKQLTQTEAQQGAKYVILQFKQHQLGDLPAQLFNTALRKPAQQAPMNHLMQGLALSQRAWQDVLALASTQSDWANVLAPAPVKWSWSLPPTLPEPLVPADNPMSAPKAELGRYLFYDVRLSGNQTTACATCHLQEKAFTDGKPVSIGSTGQPHPRGALSLGNAAYNVRLTWANPQAMQLETQIDVPMFGMHPVEMGVNEQNKQTVIARIQADKFYQHQFKLAFPGQDHAMSWGNIKKAISTFQRTLITGNSRYDAFLRREKGAKLTKSEQNGYLLFFSSAKCFACHGSFNFNDADTYKNAPPPDIRFHNTGLFNVGGTGAFPKGNRGIFEFTKKPADMGKFRAPSLRNIAVTAPYMHDGSMNTLEEVLDFYANHGRNITSGPNAGDGRRNPNKSKDVDAIRLTEQEKADIVAYLKTLTDEGFLKNPKFADPFKKAL